MTTIALPATAATGEIDNRTAYVSFGFAYVLGHGGNALAQGPDPVLALPSWLPTALLASGLAAGTVLAMLGAARAQRGADKDSALSGKLIGLAWISGLVALFVAVTGISAVLDVPDLQTMLWPAGSGLVVGLLYVAEGAVRRNLVHYYLGTWLTLVSAAALALGLPGVFWMLAIAGGGGYVVATVCEGRRLRSA